MKKSLIIIILFSVLIIGINDSQLAFAGGISDPDVDNDNDGFTENQGDCNDNNREMFPGQGCDIVDGLVGGEISPIDTTSLLLAGVHANYSILTALAVVGVGAGFAFLFFVNKFVCSWRIWAKTLSFSNFRY